MQIDQFLPAAAAGDGVTGSALLFQNLLRQAGYSSRLIAGYRPDELRDRIELLDDTRQLNTEPDLLLVHHSMGHDFGRIVTDTSYSKVMVYHNITPAEMFEANSGEARYAKLGRKQLQGWRDYFIGAIGVSPLNCTELQQNGYSKIACIPVLVDPARFRHGIACKPKRLYSRSGLLLSVGRIAENKRQHLMIEAMAHLKRILPQQRCPKLVISGSTTSPHYEQYLHTLVQHHNLGTVVVFTGKTTEQELKWLYQNASVLWCTSAHEGFCMPLIEANAFNLPIIAIATSNIPATMGQSGLLLDTDQPQVLAATTAELLESPVLQAKLKHAGQKNLALYEPEHLLLQLKTFLSELKPLASKEY